MDGRHSGTFGVHHALNHSSQLALGNIERSTDDGAERHFERNHHAARFERVHDPAETAETDRPIIPTVRVLRTIDGTQHPDQYASYVTLGPGTRLARDRRNRLRRGVILAAQPDIDLKFHLTSLIASCSV